jgi:hypothetical protein
MKTQRGSTIKRHGYVGKRIGDYIYFHRDYWLCVDAVDKEVYDDITYLLPSSFDFNIVKYPMKKSDDMKITFLWSPDFDSSDEPYIEEYVIYYADRKYSEHFCTQKHVIPKKKQIYHHKWLFVADDYEGFDVKKSMERSEKWLKIKGIDYHRIGYKDYWEREIIPLINDLK